MKKLLIVVDYQKDFVDGSLGFAGAEALDASIAQRIADYHAAGNDVVFTLDTHGTNYAQTQEGRKLPVPHCLFGEAGWELYGSTAAARGDGDWWMPGSPPPSIPRSTKRRWMCWRGSRSP